MEIKRLNIKSIGILFLIAMFTSLAGGGIIESILKSSDFQKFLIADKGMLKIGVILEMINGLAVVGIAGLFFQVLRKQYKTLASTYFGLRLIEGIACITAAYIPLSILHNSTGNTNYIIETLLSVRYDISSIVIPLFFCTSAFILYGCLYKSKSIPRIISIWGFTGILGITILNLSNSESSLMMLLALPIILNEIFLGIWLIIKGFQQNTTP